MWRMRQAAASGLQPGAVSVSGGALGVARQTLDQGAQRHGGNERPGAQFAGLQPTFLDQLIELRAADAAAGDSFGDGEGQLFGTVEQGDTLVGWWVSAIIHTD